MKKNGFLLIGLAAIPCVLVGGAYKHTALRDKRVELTYRYDVSYTVEVPDVDPVSADMFIERMGLYLDSKTVVGSVKKVGRAPAASGKEGLLFRPGDAVELADCLSRLMEDTALRQRLSEQARKSYEEHYTAKAFASGVEAAYQRVLEGRKYHATQKNQSV